MKVSMKKPSNYPWLTDLWLASLIVLPAILAWEILVRLLRIPVYLLPAPSIVLANLADNFEVYIEASLLTLSEAPEGVTVQELSRLSGGVAVRMRCEAGKAEPGLKGNLIIEAGLFP